MKLKEINSGVIINIENTPSYPKLKIKGGYVDMRDEIVNKSGNCDDKEVTEMYRTDLIKQFGEDGLDKWIEDMQRKYIPEAFKS